MKHPVTVLFACVFVALGMWLSLHATNVTDAACWGYMAGMFGACSVRIEAKEGRL